MTLKLAIWDMDGTIVDSRAVITEAMARAFEACGLAAPAYAQTRHVVGLGLDEACRRLAPENYPAGDLADLVEAYRRAFVVRRADPDFREPLYDGALELLTSLANDNWLIAMATGKSRRGIEALFAMHPLEPLFDTIHCADDGPGKPHPFMVEAAMHAVGAERSASLIIGDAIHDIQMGRAAGIHTIGVSWGFGEAHELQRAGAHEIMHAFADLDAALCRFSDRAMMA